MTYKIDTDIGPRDKYLNIFRQMQQGFCIVEVLFDNAGDAYDYRFIEVNPVFEKQTGLSNVIGKTIRELQPGHEQYWFEKYGQIVKTGEPLHFENKAAHLGNGVWYEVFALPVGMPGTNQLAILFNDVTRRKNAELALRKSEEREAFLLRLSDAVRPLSDPVAVYEAVTRTAMAHFAADRCFYCEIRDGNTIVHEDAYRPDLQSAVGVYPLSTYTLFKQVVEQGKPVVVNDLYAADVVDESLRQICVILQIIAFIDIPVIKNGRSVGILCIGQTVPRHWTTVEIELAEETAERAWEAVERARAGEELALVDRRKDEFLAMLGHELRNPMATIRAGLQLLTMADGDQALIQTTLEMLVKQADDMSHLTDDLLDVSRINLGKIELQTECLDLVELVSQTAQANKLIYQQHARMLHVELPETPVFVEGDAVRLTQIVTNLLTNGARYTGENGEVWLSLRQQGMEAVIEVRDNGIGLETGQLTAIFGLFIQADNSPARSKGGLGIGLSLVKRLVEMHGGRVEAHSLGLHQGSTFRIYLPAVNSVPKIKSTSSDTGNYGNIAPKILIIDDNADAANTLGKVLVLKGCEVHVRHGGRSGIEAAETLHPTAILMDIGMPDLNGYEACRIIRQKSWGKSLLIIAVTGYGKEQDRQHALENGFDEHLVKPVDMDKLMLLLRR